MTLGYYGHLGTDGAEMGEGRVLSGPCQVWTSGDLIRATPGFDNEIAATYDLEPWARFATVTLWRLAGRQARFKGLCEKTIRPVAADCITTTHHVDSARWADRWPTVRLVDAPIYDVLGVVVDGAALPSDSWRLAAYRDLIRVDGQAWPYAQDLGRASSVPEEGDTASRVGTWQVTYRVGQEVQPDAVLAASVFAAELAMSRGGSTKCRLPQRYWQKRIDPMTFISEGKTGIPEVDMWLQSVNPGGVTRRAKLSNLRDVARRARGRVLS